MFQRATDYAVVGVEQVQVVVFVAMQCYGVLGRITNQRLLFPGGVQ